MLQAENRRQGLLLERARASKQYRDGRFWNPSGLGPGLQGNALPLMGEWLFGKAEKRPKMPLPVASPLAAWTRAPETGFRVTWLGHSTLLCEIDGARILTDPVFGERASPVSFAGPRRFHAVPAKLAELPPLDAVLLSHDHYDHLCAETVAALAKTRVPFVTSLGVGAHLVALGVDPERIVELDWGDRTDVGPLTIWAAPAQHFSGRGLGDRNRTLWSSWVVQGERHKLFFSGDTGLGDHFAEIGRVHGPFDLVMLEIGAFHPAWGAIHLGPENALKAHAMLGGGTLLPVHWGTFDLALHAWDEPAETLLELGRAAGAKLLTPGLGDAVEPAHVEGPTAWWRGLTLAR